MKSLMDKRWIINIESKDGIMFSACGVLFHFEKTELSKLFSKLADNFSEGEIVFDAVSEYSLLYYSSNWNCPFLSNEYLIFFES